MPNPTLSVDSTRNAVILQDNNFDNVIGASAAEIAALQAIYDSQNQPINYALQRQGEHTLLNSAKYRMSAKEYGDTKDFRKMVNEKIQFFHDTYTDGELNLIIENAIKDGRIKDNSSLK